jgi:tetratricopeptide (TPR) repeat protein
MSRSSLASLAARTARPGAGRSAGRALAVSLGACLFAHVLCASAPEAAAAPAAPAKASKKKGEDDALTELPLPPEDDAALEEPGGLTPEERMEQFEISMLRAARFENKNQLDDALREYNNALKLQPGDPGALRGRAYLRARRARDGTCPRRAIDDLKLLRTYDPRGLWLAERRTLVEWMGRCEERYDDERLSLALELAEQDPRTEGRPPDIRYTVAALLNRQAEKAASTRERDSQREAALKQLDLYRRECVAAGRKPGAGALRLEADLLLERNDLEAAIAVNEELSAAYPGTPLAKRAKEQVDELRLQVELNKLEKEQGGRPSEHAEQSYRRGLAAMRAGDLDAAERELLAAIENSPWYPKAHYILGVIYARKGRIPKAVDQLKLAVRMDRFDYEAHMALGLIYKKQFAGAEDVRAIEHLEKALLLRPDLHHLHILLGELNARTNREAARRHYERFLRVAPSDDPDRPQAERALKDLTQEVSPEEPLYLNEPPDNLQRLDPSLQRMINEAYLRVSEEGDLNQAEKILQRARERFRSEPVVYNELAKVVYAQGRTGDARQFWEQSLALAEEQMEVHERLGILLERDLPAQSTVHLRRAAELGSATARFRLAKRLWDDYSFIEASEQLDQFLREADEYSLHWDAAHRLRERMDDTFLRIYLGAGALAFLLVAIPAWQIYRRLRGASLAQMLERAPKSFPEVARILSLIRHEILKHNTSFLSDVGRALEMDEPDAEARAAVVAARLFGAPRERSDAPASGRVSLRERGIHGRFLGYVDELQKVGRAHNINLNLYRKDPIFSAMIAAFEDLRGLEALQRAPIRERHALKLEWARRLSRSGHVLGRKAFEELSNLIRSLCIVTVDAATIREIFAQVVAEPQFAGVQIAEPEIAGEAAKIRVFHTDLEDIVTNVLRNSLQSSVLYGPKPIALGIDLVTETDEITGLSTLAIRIKDQSTEQLSNEMLRGRYVERGMGITADLLSRYDGSIAVEPERGWQKAVVLRFFTVEEGP